MKKYKVFLLILVLLLGVIAVPTQSVYAYDIVESNVDFVDYYWPYQQNIWSGYKQIPNFYITKWFNGVMEGDHATGMVYIQRLDKPGKAPIYCVEPDEEFNNSLTGYTNFDDISQVPNINNITQEMQLEILKRDKLNYTFQSLSIISIIPMVMLEPLKSWALSNFSFTKSFYNGKLGMIVQILVLLVTFVCYILIRKLKDNGAVNTKLENNQNPWQAKLYNIKPVKKFVDLFIPKEGTKERRKIREALKAAASKQKIEWLYINRLILTVVVFIASIIMFMLLHNVQINYIYTEPTTDYDLIGEMNDRDYKKAMETTKTHNYFLDMFKGKLNTTQEDIEKAMRKSTYYRDADDQTITSNATKILDKLQTVNSEYLKWFEILLAMVFAIIGYAAPILMLKFQVIIRKMAMEDEVMQFQTIILMLMRLERVDVEMILEWMERYADIFKEPISRCLNDYESGSWEALEDMKEEISFQPLIRIIESLQTAVEKVPIKEAFDELDSDREYYQDKRKEANDRLISKKGMIGRAIGFTPLVGIFVGYLVVPLVVIGLTSMTSSFATIQAM